MHRKIGNLWVGYRDPIELMLLPSNLDTGRPLHYKVEQPRANTLHVKNATFYIKHHQNGSKFDRYFF